jgi:2-polyprenyl-6-methoxyphenol hydroxylase-like FAD-dependent oxidoreductase
MSTAPRILIAGGGIAGNALALQLVRAGIPTTVVERATTPRPGGQAVDLRGPSREAAERMGLMPGIRRHQLDERGMSYVDERGRIYGRMAMEDFDGEGAIAEIEITRGDLNQVLLDALAEAVALAPEGLLDYRYDDHAVAFAQDADGVDVTFASGLHERYDLVVGADGVHSATRRLAFGAEEEYATFLGGYCAFFTMPTPDDIEPGWFAMRLVPGAMLGIRPDADPATSKAIMNVRVDQDPALRRDTGAQRALLRRTLEGAGWHAATVLEAMEQADDFYFDELARVDMPSLSAGRVTLVGDAGYCGSPLTGMGTAMALVGAYVLADEIAASPSARDFGRALARYERTITPFIEGSRQIPGGSIAMMLPRTRIMTRLARVNVKLMLSRPLRPLAKRLFATGGGEVALPAAA